MYQSGIVLNGFACPVCECDNHVIVDEVEVWETDDNHVKRVINLFCEECESFFSIEQILETIIQSQEFKVISENHHSEFGEGIYC
jgi:hypothetical protein